MKKIKTIAITGGAGFIGSHMNNYLIQKNFNVIVIDNLSYGSKKNINKKAVFIKGDILNKKLLIKSLKNVDAVIHLAAMSRSGPSNKEIDFCLEQNVIGTKNVLEACRLNKVKRLVYAGSSTFYGNRKGSQHENFKSDFKNPYGLSKYLGEELCLFYNKKKYVECNIMRYFNVYGDNQPISGIYALVIGIFINNLKNKKHLTIFGDGTQKRDFIHINDVVIANYKALLSKTKGEVFNVGFGSNFSINYIAKLISKKIRYTKKRKNDAKETLANIDKIKKKLNWKPSIDVKDGILNLLN